ncbi:hypothetical protein Nepgr_012591 [Nepenthes gracilis]|uniref:NAC domain-containing protein n=1 Tax=Nepenthes gracilis TaxID=150966 RepID=A0AAD3SH72_NEPGR|nr:hypothetical protein Nepgr_012591 [Nepenthes gracilis]
MEGGQKEESLPPGFRFHPSDEELISYYLINKISDANFTGRAIADVDLNKCEPWDLPGKAKMGGKEMYFFSLQDRKYPTGVRTNRATKTGYWKTTGKDKEIFNGSTSELIGMKKTLVFYRGRAPRGEKTNWVMHEYRLPSRSAYRSAKDEWVICRVFHKIAGLKRYSTAQSRVANLGMAPTSILPSPTMHADPGYFLPMGRNYMSNVELAELSMSLRGGATSTNLPIIHQPQMNYPTDGGCFTISGLNLNLGGAAPAAPQPVLRPMTPPSQAASAIGQHDHVNSCMLNMENGYGAGVSVGNGGSINTSRFVNMEHCAEFDSYWPSY